MSPKEKLSQLRHTQATEKKGSSFKDDIENPNNTCDTVDLNIDHENQAYAAGNELGDTLTLTTEQQHALIPLGLSGKKKNGKGSNLSTIYSEEKLKQFGSQPDGLTNTSQTAINLLLITPNNANVDQNINRNALNKTPDTNRQPTKDEYMMFLQAQQTGLQQKSNIKDILEFEYDNIRQISEMKQK